MSILGLFVLAVGGYFFFKEDMEPNSVLVLELQQEIPEYSPGGIEELLGGRQTMRQVVQSLKHARDKQHIKGCVLKLRNLQTGWAKADELRTAILDFQSTGKPVLAYLETAGPGEYYLASAADHVLLAPEGMFHLALRLEALFLKGTFEKLKIEPDFLREGKYKSAIETFERDSMSEPQREQLTELLDSIFNVMSENICKSREIEPAKFQEAIDETFLSAKRALELGLVDKLAYPNEIDVLLKKELGVKEINKITNGGSSDSEDIFASVSGKPKVALVYAVGTIVSGESQNQPPFGAMVGSDTVWEQLEEIREDDSIKAVVLRVNSPGGSGLASDVIWRAVERLRKKKKPVVVSMSNVAASGGYYISMGANKIIAEPTTITGSIGVFAGKFNMRGFYEWLGINKEMLKKGEHADIFGDYGNFTPEQRELLQNFLADFYKTFVTKAAEGRGKTYEELHAVAQGRVWTGEQALEVGLIDELGGLDRAIDVAKEEAGISKDQEIRLIIYPRKKSVLEYLREKGGRFDVKLPASIEMLMREEFLAEMLEREKVLALSPEFLDLAR